MVKKFILIFILLLALILRIYRVDTNPPALYWDEVAMGYNALSIAKTGADEYGHRLPFFFESFQDYKLPGYIYTLVPLVSLLGLTPIAIRLPSVIFGILSIIGIYLLGKNILGSKIGLLSAFLFSIIPWHIHLTRAGFEASGGLAFLIFGLVFLWQGIQKGLLLRLIGIVFLALSLCFYNGVRLISPLMLISYFLFFWKKMPFSRRDIIWVIVTLVLLSPILYQFVSPSAQVRFSYTSIFTDQSVLAESIQKRIENNNIFGKLWYNRYIVYGNLIIKNHLAHFSPDFLLFNTGENPRHKVKDIGLLYLWTAPFIVFGLYFLVRQKSESLKLIIPLLIAAPIASAVTIPSPHALRSFPLIIPLVFLISTGIIYTIRQEKLKKILIIIFITIFSISNMTRYLFEYYTVYPKESDTYWGYGYKEMFEIVRKYDSAVETIYITGKYWRPYIYALYYMSIDPKNYQQNPGHSQIGKMIFGYADYDQSDPFYDYKTYDHNTIRRLRKKDNTLLILLPNETRGGDIVIESIKDLKGKILFNIVQGRSK